jgi:putative ABC transport system permease protein
MHGLWRDLRFGMRMLAKSPGFAAVAVLTLALGIGANTAIFQLIDAVRLRTLPVRDPQTLAIVHLNRNHWASGNFNGAYAEYTYPLWQQIRERQQAFSSIAAWGGDSLNLATGGEVDYARSMWVSGEFFRTLGVQPVLGRLLSDEDDQPGCAGGVDLSYAFWQRRYGGAANVIGQTLTLEGHEFPIFGVTPPSFYGVAVGDGFDVAVPVCAEAIIRGENSRITSAGARRDWWLSVFGRLKPGWTLTRATAQLNSFASAALHETIPPEYDAEMVKHYLAYTLEARPAANGFSSLRHDASTPLWLLLGLSGLVLLIACANLANLLLARAGAREREVAMRLALGASRGRLTLQLLSESALLAIAGTLCGGLLAVGLSRGLVSFLSTPDNPIFLDIAMDWRFAGFAAGLAVLTTILFGLAPALRAGSVAPGVVLKAGGRAMTAGRDRFRLQRILVASQVALSLVLLAGAFLFARSLQNLMSRNLGFQQNGVLVVNADFTRLNLPEAQGRSFTGNLLDRIRAIPGVAAAADSNRSPISGSTSNEWVLDKNGNHPNGAAFLDYISPGYFETMEMPILLGRDFNDNDTATSPKVVIVNQAFVKKFLNGAKDPVGGEFRMWEPPGKPEPYYTVVGVVKDSVYDDIHAPVQPVMYFPRTELESPFSYSGAVFLVRSKLAAGGLLNSVKDTIASVNPEIAIQFKLLPAQIRESLVQDELMATLCGFFGGLAVLLAAIGLYGVISYTVSQRTNEMGIRMALGAHRASVLRLILGEVAVLILVGAVIGAALALAGGKTANSLLFGLKAHDPATLALAVVVLAAIGFAASFVPARRASRMDPMTALRYE